MRIRRQLALSALTALSGALGTTGCTHAHTVYVPVSDVPALVERYAASSRIVVDDQGTSVLVTPRGSPNLEIGHSCNFLRLFDCSPTLRAPLERVRFDNATLHFPDVVLKDNLDIPPADVTSAAVQLLGHDRAAWRPTWGVGGSAGGVAGSLAVALHWLPQEWLALEAGVLPMLPEVLGGYAAIRLRPLALGPIRPFTGWFVNGTAISHGETTAATTDYDGVGPRLGFDFEIRRAHVIVTLEGDLVHPFDRDQEYFGQRGRWVPWGGGGVAYFF